MKLRTFITIAAIFILCGFVTSCKNCTCSPCTCKEPCKCNGTNCGNGNCCTPSCGVDSAKMPLNVSVFIDLSDRVLKDADGTTQLGKDTSIVIQLASIVRKKAWDNNIRTAKDHFKVFFYPAPTEPTINGLAQKLDIDLSKYSRNALSEKMQQANDMVKIVDSNIKVIYNKAISEANFIGCDIWGFFNDKAQSYCVKKGYRNILFVLTDGYIYHVNNMVTDANNQTTYITNEMLSKKSQLMPCKADLSELEVLFLEINANPKTNYAEIQNTIRTWLKSMGVKRYDVVGTDLPNNTKTIIDNFVNL